MGTRKLIRLRLREEALLLETVVQIAGGGVGLIASYAAGATILSGRGGRACAAIHRGLETGTPLETAARSCVARLDPLHRAMLGAVDASGDAVGPLAHAARYLRTRSDLRERCVSVAVYPAFVAGVAIVAAVLLVTLVVPAARELFAPLAGSEVLTGTAPVTAAMMTIAALAAAVAVPACIAALARRAERSRRDRLPPSRASLRASQLVARTPVVGRLATTRSLLAFAHVAGALERVGVPLTDALTSAAAVVPNSSIARRLSIAADRISRGESMGRSIADALPREPALALRLEAVEHGADPADSLGALTRDLEHRLDAALSRLGALAEPVLIVLAGSVVLAVVLGFVRPLFELYGSILP